MSLFCHLEMLSSWTSVNLFLTLYHTIPTFNDREVEDLLKTLWEKEKMLVPEYQNQIGMWF